MVDLRLGDCLEVMKDIPDGSVDMVLTDPPYGTTACKWDSVIPFEPMWEQINRVIKPNGAIVLFGSEPFSSALRMSNIKNYKYDWIWVKSKVTGFLNVKKQPLRNYETISCFYRKQPTYNPEMKHGLCQFKGGTTHYQGYGKMEDRKKTKNDLYYPKQILNFSSVKWNENVHPTQKPVPLLEYLIRTYTNEGETVLDFTMGSGSTGVACKNLNRNFIGIELDPTYFEIAKNRIEGVQ